MNLPDGGRVAEPDGASGGAVGVGLTLLADVARVLHGPTSVEEKLAWLLAVLADVAEADLALFVSFDDDSVAAVHPKIARPGPGERWHREAAAKVRQMLATAEAVRSSGSLGLGDTLAVAVAGDDRRHGAIVLGNHDDRPLSDDAEHITATLAVHLGVALDNAETVVRLRQLESAQRDLVDQLQDAVKPPRPVVADTELGVYYLAADPQEPTGGDLYDWQVLPNGDVHLSVVDVLGKGVAATKDALAVTHALRLLVFEGVALDEVVKRADEILATHDSDLVATVIVGRYRPATGELILAGGGHPPALIVHADGDARLVSAPGIPIGWPGAGSDGLVTVTLERRDTVVLYTDGLIESGKDILVGLDSLVDAGREVGDYPAEHLARALVHRALVGSQRRDDIVAVVLRRRSAPTDAARVPLPPFNYSFRASAAAVGLARRGLADWLAFEPIDPEALDDLLLIANELCVNATEANDAGDVALRAWVEGGDVVIEVEDSAGSHPGVAGRSGDHPDPLLERGRGLYLVTALADSIDVVSADGRTVVRCRKAGVAAVGASGP